jgi:hypothetical protein
MDMEKIATIHINGCTVTVPAEDEKIYRDALADKWIDGCRVYVKDQEVVVDMSDKIKKEGMSVETLRDLLIEQNNKTFALAGRYTRDYNVNDSLFVYDEQRKVIHAEEDRTPLPVFEALVRLCSTDKWKNKHNRDVLHNMFPSLTLFQFGIVVMLFTNECEDGKLWEYRGFLEEFGVDLTDDEKNMDIEDLKGRGILLGKYWDGADGPLEYLRLNSRYELFIQEAGIHRIVRGDNPFGLIEE